MQQHLDLRGKLRELGIAEILDQHEHVPPSVRSSRHDFVRPRQKGAAPGSPDNDPFFLQFVQSHFRHFRAGLKDARKFPLRRKLVARFQVLLTDMRKKIFLHSCLQTFFRSRHFHAP
ncbi:hypothetical protein SDC9_193650 [bioreactor metagenome]|uniref:Uncharacterized protein n=1 Tax=bioreactor metagenome TaxID=1076179 RepID=A0A645I4N7_9ZZZZ